MNMNRVLIVAAAGLVMAGLTMGAAPRIAAKKAAKKSFNPFTLKAPAASARPSENGGNPVTNPGGWDNDPPGKAVRKKRPPVRPGHRPPARSKVRPDL